MTDYLLDTNHVSNLMGNDPRIVQKLRQFAETSDTFGISMTVLGELYYAVYASQHRQQNLHRLRQLLKTLLIYPYDQSSAEIFGQIQAEQKVKGRAIPPLDAQIGAVARRYNLVVLTADKHFSYISALKVENWLA
jgi:tRNA(fMet)-specific endonuclease VapC